MKVFNKRFDRKISIYFFVISMVIIFTLSFLNYSSSVNVIKQSIEEENMQQLKTASIYIASYLEKIKGLNNLLSMTPDIINNLNNNGKEEDIRKIIDLTKSSEKSIKSIMIVSKDGRLISTSGSKMNDKNNVLNESWYEDALRSINMAQITTASHKGFTMEKSERVISLSSEIRDKNNDFIGLSIIDISYNFIEDYISTVNLGDSGFSFILDKDNNLIFDSTQMNNKSLEPRKDYVDLINGSKYYENTDFTQAQVYISNTEWLIVQVRSPEEIYALNQKLIREIVFWGLIVLIISIIMSVYISKKINNPIVRLIGDMKKIDINFKDISVDQNASVEIKTLTQEFNILLGHIKKLTKDIELKENTKRIYELKALQSQINPHFIYNTLDTVLWLVELGENEKSIEVIKSLGSILRNTLSIDRDFIELKQELDHVKNYMDIQKIRYDDKFDYNFNIYPATEGLMVPKLLVQPIVENSIYHGIKPKKGKGHIVIEAAMKEGDLIITIEDDGVGFKKTDKAFKKTDGLRLGGIGMANVDQRLKILYGPGYGLKYKSENGITRVCIKVRV